MYVNAKEKLSQLPPDYPAEILPILRNEFLQSEKSIVVLDDDPTGTQTCYDVTVLTRWSTALLLEELKQKPSVLFILTNSRSLPEKEAIRLTLEICRNVSAAALEAGREIVMISRSDSTLRGHFPAEVDAMAEALDMKDAVRILVPAFIEGGRYTIDEVHYLVEHEDLVPVSDTPFSKDVVFGYKNANLKEWVEEKTKGKVSSSTVIAVSIDDIRSGGPQTVCKKLMHASPGQVCVVNAVSYRDLEVFSLGALLAEKSGKKFLYRTSATFVPIRAGMASGKFYKPEKNDLVSPHGSLIVVGSHVPKTTSQLGWLLANGKLKSIEINVQEILQTRKTISIEDAIIQQTDKWIAAGVDVVIHTSRKLELGHDSDSSLKINSIVSDFLVEIVKGLTVRPKFIIAKGGITSSDLATKGLSVEKAIIRGAVIPGVPVWQLDSKSKFPDILYVVFPGNVGSETALIEVLEKFES